MRIRRHGTRIMNLEDIHYENREGVAIATLQRTERLNALRSATLRELLTILNESAADNSVRVLVITGRGRAFCSGEDLKELDLFMSMKESREHVLTFQEITRRIVNHPNIIIAALNGIAVGAGAEIAVASDIRIASEKATLAFVEAKRALFPTNGVLYLLPRLIGQSRAAELLVTGNTVTARAALDYGLVNHVVADKQLLEFTLELARTISRNASISVRLIKRALRRSFDLDLEAAMQLEVDGCMECQSSDDMAEGVRAFLEKRSPQYFDK